MKTWMTLSLFASLALAQSSSSGAASAAASADPLVPTGLSTGCQKFIDEFNGDTSLNTCTQALIKATQNFAPGASAGSSPTQAQVTSSINDICTGTVPSACPDSLIRGKLADFYSACPAELTSSPNQQARDIYDVLYLLIPLRGAICSKDDNGDYCVISNSTASSADNQSALASQNNVDLSQVQKSLYYTPGADAALPSRGEDAILANLTTFRSNNIPYLFRNANWDNSALCTPCTRNILTNYFNFESDCPYAPGLASNTVLGGQNTLVGAIQQKCGANFLNGAVQAAGGIKSDPLASSAVKDVSDRFAGVIAVVVGGLTVAIASL